MATIKERKEFWNVLKTFDGENIENEIKIASDLVQNMLPDKLCRYRSVSTKSLEALRTNNLVFSTSNYYDDPFDTFLHIDMSTVRKEIESAISKPNTFELLEMIKENYQLPIPNKVLAEVVSVADIEKIINNVKNYLENDVRNEMRKSIYSICFSENEHNENLWLKYADNHKGFVQVYNMKCEQALICGTQSFCKNCDMGKRDFYFYPVCYSDKKYDATNFAKWFSSYVLLKDLVKNCLISYKSFENIISHFPKCRWEKEKISLIKKYCHHYDEEWRLLTPKYRDENDPIKLHIKWIPSKIVLGLNMKVDEKRLVASIANQAGIKNIYEAFIDDNDELSDRKYIYK